MEELLDQLLRLSQNCGEVNTSSMQDVGGSYLERSHGSSSSSNCSWISESSCGCHSPRPLIGKSSLIFHRKPILPPVICGQARSEMLAYKAKAIQKEEIRREKNRGKLLSRVEEILSSISSGATSSTASQESSPRCPVAYSTVSKDTAFASVEQNIRDPETEGDHQTCVQNSIKHTNTCSWNNLVFPKPSQSDMPSPTRTQEPSQVDPYKQSFQNLVQKFTASDSFLNSSCNSEVSDCGPVLKTQDLAISDCVTSLPPVSENTDLCESSNTIKPTESNGTPQTDQESCEPHFFSTDDTYFEGSTFTERASDIDLMACQLVNDVLKEVRTELESGAAVMKFGGSDNAQSEEKAKETNLWKNISDENINSPNSSIESKLSENQNATVKSAKALKQLGLPQHIAPITPLLDCSDVNDTMHPEVFDSDREKGCCKTLSNVASILEEKAVASRFTELETSLHSVLSESSGDIPRSAHRMYDSDVTTSVMSHAVISPKTDCCEAELTTKSVTPCRVRRNSYSLDAPSPFLVSSRDQHTFAFDADDEMSLVTADGSNMCHEVMRSLELLSDSEDVPISDSFTSPLLHKQDCVKLKGRDKSAVEHYCQALELKHKKEMAELQYKHELMLVKFHKELMPENKPKSDGIPANAGCLSRLSKTDLHVGANYPNLARQTVDEKMHKRWCKLSALVKGHLTRQLLGSHHVQSIMQTIRDTSRTILSIQNERSLADTNMHCLQDATLVNRLMQQLQASLIEFHEVFFDLSAAEQMNLIKQSDSMSKRNPKTNRHAGLRLSSATLKSMQRKKLDRKKQSVEVLGKSKKMNSPVGKTHKQVKSKISYIWKGTKN